MSGTFYKAFGFVAWKGARWYVRRRMGHPGRRTAGMSAGLGAAALAGAAVLLHRRNGHKH
jgi:hypothetical protein